MKHTVRWMMIAFVLGGVACNQHSCWPSSWTFAPPAPSVAPIDGVYEEYKAHHHWMDPVDGGDVIEPENKEGSVATFTNPRYDICYEELPIEKRLRVETDADFVRMVRWLRDGDPCVRCVAEHVLSPALGRGKSDSISDQETDGVEYQSLLCALSQRIDASGTAHDPNLFAGTMVSLDGTAFRRMLKGRWREEPSSERQTSVAVLDATSNDLQLTKESAQPSEPSPTHIEWSSHFEEVRTTPLCRFAIDGRTPEMGIRHFLFLPVTNDLVWFAYSNEGVEKMGDPRWQKMRRAGGS
jgi:hypothetical protein